MENRMRFKTMIFAVAFLMLSTRGVLAQDSTAELKEKIDAYVKEAVDLDAFSGTALVTKNGGMFYETAVGEASKSYKFKNTINTRFNIGSIGKIFTATAVMQLVQNGKIDLNDTIDKYLPDFPYPEKSQITISRLLSHTAGLGDFFEHPDFYARKQNIREISDFLPLIYEMKLVAKPGEKFQYSNSSFVILGAVIEKASGKIYRDYIRENIFQPLDMNDTDIIYREDIVYNVATGYFPKNADEIQQNVYYADRPSSAGGICSTVYDLAKLDQGLRTEKILKKEFIQKMYEPSKANPEYGFGWEILDDKGHKLLGHSGGHYGLEAIFYRYIDDGYTIIVLSNYSGGAGHVASAMADILFRGKTNPVDKALLNAQKGLLLYELGKREEAIKVIDRNITGQNPHLLSHYLAARLRIISGIELEKAVQILDRYLELAPDDIRPSKAAAWWRKGVAYEKMKDKARAAECYHKSLELDPDLSEAKESLKSLDDMK